MALPLDRIRTPLIGGSLQEKRPSDANPGVPDGAEFPILVSHGDRDYAKPRLRAGRHADGGTELGVGGARHRGWPSRRCVEALPSVSGPRRDPQPRPGGTTGSIVRRAGAGLWLVICTRTVTASPAEIETIMKRNNIKFNRVAKPALAWAALGLAACAGGQAIEQPLKSFGFPGAASARGDHRPSPRHWPAGVAEIVGRIVGRA
jgi:hypothetical protein